MRKVRAILTLVVAGCLAACQSGTESQADESIKPATYAVPRISGSYTSYQGTKVGGVEVDYTSAVLYPDSSGSEILLQWDDMTGDEFDEGAHFRLTLASDLRTFQKFYVFTAENQLIDSIDLSLGTPFQPVQCKIPLIYVSEVLSNGLKVRLKGPGVPVEVFTKTSLNLDNFLPHLLIPGEQPVRKAFLDKMASTACLTEYGWQEGCVLDGIALLADRAMDGSRYQQNLEKHLSLIFPDNDSINHDYEQLSIEFTSCLAQLARHHPDHPEIEHVLAFWESKADSAGIVKDGNTIVAEANYTVAWPLAVMSEQLNRPELAEEAIRQLRFRQKYLVDEEGAIWLRYNLGSQERTFPLWSRGMTWYFLGLAKTLDALPDPPQDLIEELQRAAKYLMALQRDDGMWTVFANDNRTAPETSGTSGIATALAIGVRRGWLGEDAEKSARRALEGVEKRLTADGFLQGVAEENKGGIAFQRQTKGSMCHWGMGLYAQLLAELAPPEK